MMLMIQIEYECINRRADEPRRHAEVSAVESCLRRLGFSQSLSHKPSGAPYLSDFPRIKVSVSHSASVACVAIGEDDEIFGIDVEETSRIAQLQRVLNHFSNPADEFDPDIDQNLVKAWTAKEAVFKAINHKENCTLPRIAISVNDLSRATIGNFAFELSYTQIPPNNMLCLAKLSQ